MLLTKDDIANKAQTFGGKRFCEGVNDAELEEWSGHFRALIHPHADISLMLNANGGPVPLRFGPAGEVAL